MRRSLFAVWTWVGIALLLTGCPGKPSQPTAAGPAPVAKTSAALATEVEEQLKSALYQLQPENLGIDAHLNDAVSVLNHWWSAVVAAELQPTGLTPPALPTKFLPEGQVGELTGHAYTLRDGFAIREAFVAKAIAEHRTEGLTDDVDRITRLFEYVCRNVVLTSEDDFLPPLTVYESLILGLGRAEHRAWIFATLLRQLRMDAVILQVPSAFAGEPGSWLIGVPWDKQVYLFDAKLGLPIPRGDAASEPRPKRPATLAEFLANPDWTKPLAARSDQPYEPTAEQLATAKVQLIADPEWWSPRLWDLEQLLPAEYQCVLYDAPAAFGDTPGVFGRVAANHPGWSAEALELWPFVADQQQGFAKPTKQMVDVLKVLSATFSVPFEVNHDDKSGQPRVTPTQRLLKIRTDQLRGKYSEAIAQYVTIRHLAVMQAPDPALMPLYNRAAEDASYWSCVAKFEAGEYASAVELLQGFLKRSSRGRWAAAARGLLADAQLALDKLPDAITALKMSVPDDAYRASHAVLLKRWSEIAEKK